MAYTEEDLTAAEKAGILKPAQVESFRRFVAERHHGPAIDEENFRFITSFNDIFVSFACLLVIWAGHGLLGLYFSEQINFILTAGLTWGLAEYFSRKRHLALPSITLLFAFVYCAMKATDVAPGTFSIDTERVNLMTSSLAAGLAAFLHWYRFRVPITPALGAGAVLALGISSLLYAFPSLSEYFRSILFIGGLLVLLAAMMCDLSDRDRLTYRSDSAFWLHFLAAPLLIHPPFTYLLEGTQADGLMGAGFIIGIYLFISLISICIDRRALMVSGLIYALYALQSIFLNYGLVETGITLTAFVIGSGLLLLSAFWHSTRKFIVSKLPPSIQAFLPAL